MAGIGHIAVGLAAGRFLSTRPGVRLGFPAAALGATVLSTAPDLDVIVFAFRIPYADPIGHRGASHAIATALVMAALLPCYRVGSEHVVRHERTELQCGEQFISITHHHDVPPPMALDPAVARFAVFDGERIRVVVLPAVAKMSETHGD